MTHSPQHIGQDQHTRDKSPLSGGFAVSIPDKEYRSNKKIMHKGKKLYPHEIYTEIDVPRIKKFLELNPEYKVWRNQKLQKDVVFPRVGEKK